jgi:hypothetical protein
LAASSWDSWPSRARPRDKGGMSSSLRGYLFKPNENSTASSIRIIYLAENAEGTDCVVKYLQCQLDQPKPTEGIDCILGMDEPWDFDSLENLAPSKSRGKGRRVVGARTGACGAGKGFCLTTPATCLDRRCGRSREISRPPDMLHLLHALEG